MSLRLEMLQVARVAPKALGDATDLVRDFVFRQQNADGGFKDRSGASDLYYTVFALDCLTALRAELRSSEIYYFVQNFGTGGKLDFVHLCCLARAWASLQVRSVGQPLIAQNIEAYRTADGGYNVLAGSKTGTAYAAFLALGAYQDLDVAMPDPLRLVQSLKFLEKKDGAWANEASMLSGSANATAAAVTVLRQLGQPISPVVTDWLLGRLHPDGGFKASAEAPLPDLLSTATVLHALSSLQGPIDKVREVCLDFVDTLWTNEGSFHGHWGDDCLDCEYTFYGLLATGHLSL